MAPATTFSGKPAAPAGFNPFNPWATPETALYYNRLNGLPDNFRPNPGIFSLSDAPQQWNESKAEAGVRQAVTGTVNGVTDAANWFRQALAPRSIYSTIGKPFGDAVVQAFQYAGDTPAAEQKRKELAAATVAPQQALSGNLPISDKKTPLNSWKDPRWDVLEQAASKRFGVPVEVLRTIRTVGERSNENQVSKAGARGVYQIIPSTAQGIKQNYGFDPMASAQNEVMGAAALLKEGFQRTGSWQGAMQQYHGGTNPANYGPENAAYTDRTSAALATAGGLQNPFDPRYANMALGEINNAQQAALTPQSFVSTLSPAPEAPTPQPIPQADFSKADAALAATKPEVMSEKEKLQTRRADWLRGIGSALSNMQDGEGLGTLLAHIGGGALQGAALGDKEVQARMDHFDDQMARYNIAVANQENMKAQSIQQTMAANVQATNAAAQQRYTTAYNEWAKLNNPGQVVGNNFVSSSYDPKTRQVTTKMVPISAAVDSQFALQRAEIYSSMGGQFNQGAFAAGQMRNNLVMAGAAQALSSGSPNAPDAAVLGVAGPAVTAAQNGSWMAMPEFSDPARAKAFSDEVDKRMGALGYQPALPGANLPQGYQEARQKVIAGMLTGVALSNPNFMSSLFQAAAPGAQVNEADRYINRKTTQKQTPRGTEVSSVFQ